MKNSIRNILYVTALSILCWSCQERVEKKTEVLQAKSQKTRDEYIRAIAGEDEKLDSAAWQKGEVLLSYSDCYTCHKENKKVLGPSFQDIDLRYPRQQVFIKILAQRIIHGGSGAWGHVAMKAHPKLSAEDAEAMVTYILSSPSKLQ
ncbi:hypothetical protein SMI01S_02820 [Sphingobacterium mizutaii NBRC 14946 = DSM 11724]|uniref:Cytochrome c551 n=2 Tax=Sphingobacterium mizutaii TaxID=1010 RepID=A0AAJ4XF71_9SPHI|nr:c-type cytochrome [Sphingobacterium mizutaii]GEM66676.1 hypothetical protein SMI01S_02820 [Sphingobacterium mizutaii NBRC 14946 = DSM 11724]SDL48914.1 cytochrome c [Sphingobacterium mizutaii]SNV60677.1 Cytochrome c551 [Sphingobacterium mizutaii]